MLSKPSGLTASQTAAGVLLTWNQNTEAGFKGHVIYASDIEATGTATFTRLGATGKPEYLDPRPIAVGKNRYYRVNTFDGATPPYFTDYTPITVTGIAVGTPAPASPPASPTGRRFGLEYKDRIEGYKGASLKPPGVLKVKQVRIGQDLKTVVGQLVRGDCVELERGGKFTVKNSGFSLGADEITFTAFGDPAKPKPIVELDIVTGGSSASKRSMAFVNVPSLRHRVYIAGIDFNAIERGYTNYSILTVGDNAYDVNMQFCNAISPVIDFMIQSYGDAVRMYWCDAPNGVGSYAFFAGDTSNYNEIEACYINDSKNESTSRMYGSYHRDVGNHYIKRMKDANHDGKSDGIKCYIRHQYGIGHYIAGNKCESPDGQAQVIFGPIATDGTHSSKEQAIRYIVENNVMTGLAQVQLWYGTTEFTFRGNTLIWGSPTHNGIEVTKSDAAPGRLTPTGVLENNNIRAGNFIVGAPASLLWKGKGNLLNGKPV